MTNSINLITCMKEKSDFIRISVFASARALS